MDWFYIVFWGTTTAPVQSRMKKKSSKNGTCEDLCFSYATTAGLNGRMSAVELQLTIKRF